MPKLSNFKALLFDFDKTLARTDGTVPEQIITLFRQLTDRGIALGLCAGRSSLTLQKNGFHLFPAESMHICSSGGLIVTGEGRIRAIHYIPLQAVDRILAIAKQTHSLCFAGNSSHFYASFPGDHTAYYQKRFGITPELMDLARTRGHLSTIVGMSMYLCEKEKPKTDDYTKFPPEFAQKVIEQAQLHLEYFQQIEGIFVHSVTSAATGLPYLEFTPEGLNKGTGVTEWANLQNIDPSQIIGFGDSENDLEFLQIVGYSVAMGNSKQSIKEVADKIIGHVDQDGLPNYLQQILDIGEL